MSLKLHSAPRETNERASEQNEEATDSREMLVGGRGNGEGMVGLGGVLWKGGGGRGSEFDGVWCCDLCRKGRGSEGGDERVEKEGVRWCVGRGVCGGRGRRELVVG